MVFVAVLSFNLTKKLRREEIIQFSIQTKKVKIDENVVLSLLMVPEEEVHVLIFSPNEQIS